MTQQQQDEGMECTPTPNQLTRGGGKGENCSSRVQRCRLPLFAARLLLSATASPVAVDIAAYEQCIAAIIENSALVAFQTLEFLAMEFLTLDFLLLDFLLLDFLSQDSVTRNLMSPD